jgi:tetratricopeptide (TPR) repeat protein
MNYLHFSKFTSNKSFMFNIKNVSFNVKKMQWLVFAVACLIYANTIPNKWAIDDSLIIHQNNFVAKGIAGIPDILSHDAFAGFYGKDINTVAGGRYRPLSPVLFALQSEIFASAKKDETQKLIKDKEGNKIKDLSEKTWFPHVLHFFNILWYGLLCLVLYRTLLLLFTIENENKTFRNNVLALGTSLLFAVHPLHTEAVANVKGLDEILALLGTLISLYCVLKLLQISQNNSAGNSKIQWQIAAVVSFFLALMAKESAVTFIAVIPLALWFFTQASLKSIAKLTLPLFIPLIVFLGIRAAVLNQPEKREIAEELMNDPFLVLDTNSQYAPLINGLPIKKLVNPNTNTFTKMPYSNQLATNFYTYAVYLKLLFAPYPLTCDYYPRHIEIKSFSDGIVLLSLLFHLFLLIWALYHFRKKNVLAFGILYYFITFSIVSNLFFPIGTNMAERFMFMPSLGFCLIVCYAIYNIVNQWNNNNSQTRFNIIFAGFALMLISYAIITIQRNFDWKDNFTLFSKDILVSKNSGKINTALAAEYINKAITMKTDKENEIEDWNLAQKKAALKEIEQERMNWIQKALPLLNKALEIHPMNNAAWLQMANAQHILGQVEDQAPNANLTYLSTALAAYDLADYYKAAGMDTTINKFKAICLMDLGKLMGQKFGDIPSCISSLEKAKTLSPKNAEIYLLLGTAYSMTKDYEKTIENCLKSISLRPNDRDTKQNLAVAYQQYALADASKKELLPKAEEILLDVYNEEKKLDDNNINKLSSMERTLDLLYKNATIQGNDAKQNEYKSALIGLNPKWLP